MYYCFYNVPANAKKAFANKLAEEFGFPVSSKHLAGDFPFIEFDRFGDDICLSRLTSLCLDDKADKITERAEEIAKECW